VSGRAIIERLLPMLQELNRTKRLHADMEDLPVWTRQANALAMVVNELVTNALKFSRRDLYVFLRAEDGKGLLEVNDDGEGFAEGFNPHREGYFGLDLVNGLSRIDLGGHVCYTNRPQGGACVTILFPLPS
jgi:two-component sensor histidine kinase